MRIFCAMAAMLWLASPVVAAQNAMRIDATSPVPRPQPLQTTLGAARSPDGRTIGANSQYLTLNGKPWIPVMGEFHFSRYPSDQWEQEILKMKAAGVNVIATYVIWIHHEQVEGEWNWTGQRNLHAFAELCRRHGMYLYPRIGPWAHAETRNGGLPDWVLAKSPVRENNPIYLAEVQQFYTQVAGQLKGELWKDGGPVIGIQIENEYRGTDPAAGSEHIRTLKKMAIADGLDVPLYTVTGWDGAVIPRDAVLPVFGGYPDAPWDSRATRMPPSEVYAFRFDNRSAGSMGVIGGGGQNAAASYEGTPFLTAEVGDGIEDTYFRRPVVSADDVAAIPTIMLGSGANLLGYYMFHGGRNPDGGAITLEESQRTGYPTDVPVKSYDFGDLLAPMSPRRPDRMPSSPADLSVARISARTAGDRGFVFFSNYVRGAAMPTRKHFQVELQLPSGIVHIPEQPIDLPSDAYGIWPVNFGLPGATLRYATAQLFKRVVKGSETWFFFTAIPGIVPEFSFDSAAVVTSSTRAEQRSHNHFYVHEGDSGEITLVGGTHLVVLPQAEAEQVWRVDNPAMLLKTSAAVFSDGDRWTLQTMGDPSVSFSLFGAAAAPVAEDVKIRSQVSADAIFHAYRADLPAVAIAADVRQVRLASARAPWQYGPVLAWRPNPVPMSPDDADFARAAAWRITLPPIPHSPQLADVFLSIRYDGDVARLSHGGNLVDDNFWNGLPWEIGLREIDSQWGAAAETFRLQILPLPKNLPMYIEESAKLHFGKTQTVATPPQVRVISEYQLVLRAPQGP
jgi:beta-galactosidase